MSAPIKSLVIAGILSGMAGSVHAAAHEMDMTKVTCAEFSEMDEDGRMKAMDGMKMAMKDDAMTEGAEPIKEGDATAEGAEPMKEGDTMAEGKDAMAEGDTMMSDEMKMEEMEAMAETCADDPEMMAMDAMAAMHEMKDN